MIVDGYRHGANSIEAVRAIHKHTEKPLLECKRLVESVLDGNIITLPDDFALREDLEYYKFTVRYV